MSISLHPNNRYYRDPAFRAENWFRDIIGVTILDGVDKVEVIIRASAIQARYLETKPLHHTQQIIQQHADYTDFAYQLRPNYELEARLLSLGERVEVLQPDSLRRQIQQRLQLALQHYL
jgi:predicted DNA-binding transcriptional regulator YafY